MAGSRGGVEGRAGRGVFPEVALVYFATSRLCSLCRFCRLFGLFRFFYRYELRTRIPHDGSRDKDNELRRGKSLDKRGAGFLFFRFVFMNAFHCKRSTLHCKACTMHVDYRRDCKSLCRKEHGD